MHTGQSSKLRRVASWSLVRLTHLKLDCNRSDFNNCYREEAGHHHARVPIRMGGNDITGPVIAQIVLRFPGRIYDHIIW